MRQRLERALRVLAALPPSDSWEMAEFAEAEAALEVVRSEVAAWDRRAELSARTDRYRERKATQEREWRRVRQWVSGRADGRCEVREAPGCWGGGEQAHHRRMRSQGGTDAPENLLWVCERCHRWIHDHPEVAYTRGWLIRAGGES